MARKKHDSGRDSFDLIPEKANKMHDDRAYCAAMAGYGLAEERRQSFLQKPKVSTENLVSKLMSNVHRASYLKKAEQ